MRDAEEFVSQIALEGRFAETSRLINDKTVFADNTNVFENAIRMASLEKNPERNHLGWLWKGVSLDIMENVVDNFKNAPDCLLTTKAPLLEYISWLKREKGINHCDVLLRGLCDGNDYTCLDFSFSPITRSLENQNFDGKRLTFIKRHIISVGDESAGIEAEKIEAIKADYKKRNPQNPKVNVPDCEYRRFKKLYNYPPLLILVFAKVYPSVKEVQADGKKHRIRMGDYMIVPAYGISFPGEPSCNRRPEKTVTYTVNKVWFNENSDWWDDSDDMEENE